MRQQAPGSSRRNPAQRALADWAETSLADHQAPVAVAYSGGADSTALLLAAHALWPERVIALHVNHGLQAAADGFEAMVRTTCDGLAVPLQVQRVNAAAGAGQSPEDAARRARYRALAGMAQTTGASSVLLAQHADDQAETLLLALSRGAGLPGLAGMATDFQRHGARFARPLLALSSADLRAWLLAAGHRFVEDPSNTDVRFVRNRIRAELLPAWQRCFPAYRETLARSMRHAAQAHALLEDLAQIDLLAVGQPPLIAALQSLPRQRQANALRHWLRQAGAAASEAQLGELLDQIDACRTRGHAIRLVLAGGVMERAGACLRYTPPL